MDGEIDELLRRLVRLEDELEQRIEAQRALFRYRMERRRAVFEAEVERHHRELRIGLVAFLTRAPIAHLLSAPIIYSVIVPLVLLDLAVFLYVLVCFPLWQIKRMRRADYVIVDRHRLAYLNGIEKLNCAYCGYANGVIAYAREAASRTEQYWCPIKHAMRVRAAHPRYRGFVDYGDAEGFRSRLEELRRQVREGGKPR